MTPPYTLETLIGNDWENMWHDYEWNEVDGVEVSRPLTFATIDEAREHHAGHLEMGGDADEPTRIVGADGDTLMIQGEGAQ